MRRLKTLALPALLLLLLVCAGCAAGTARFESAPAGFWNGLWHGLIVIITFVISLFSENVRMYELNNVGPLYDLGFLLGAAMTLGSCGKKCWSRKSHVRVINDTEWDDISDKVEEKVRKGIGKWLAESDRSENDWEEIGRNVEDRIKRELRKWADE